MKTSMQPNNHSNNERNNHSSQSGNIFLIILLGVALFAALSFAVSRGLQSQSTTKLSSREIKLAVSDTLSYAQRVARGVNRVRRNGCSENDISFYLSGITELADYEHSPEVDDRCKVFHPDGGGISYRAPMDGINTGPWYIFDNRVGKLDDSQNLGTSATDLTLMLRLVNEDVCKALNDNLGNTLSIWESSGTAHGESLGSSTEFAGAFASTADGINVDGNAADSPKSGCFCDATGCPSSANRFFYHTILIR